LKFFQSTFGVVAKQLYELVRMLRKTVDFRTVAGRNNKNAFDAVGFGLLQKRRFGKLVQAEMPSDGGIGFFVAQTDGVKMGGSCHLAGSLPFIFKLKSKSINVGLIKTTLKELKMSISVFVTFEVHKKDKIRTFAAFTTVLNDLIWNQSK